MDKKSFLLKNQISSFNKFNNTSNNISSSEDDDEFNEFNELKFKKTEQSKKESKNTRLQIIRENIMRQENQKLVLKKSSKKINTSFDSINFVRNNNLSDDEDDSDGFFVRKEKEKDGNSLYNKIKKNQKVLKLEKKLKNSDDILMQDEKEALDVEFCKEKEKKKNFEPSSLFASQDLVPHVKKLSSQVSAKEVKEITTKNSNENDLIAEIAESPKFLPKKSFFGREKQCKLIRKKSITNIFFEEPTDESNSFSSRNDNSDTTNNISIFSVPIKKPKILGFNDLGWSRAVGNDNLDTFYILKKLYEKSHEKNSINSKKLFR